MTFAPYIVLRDASGRSQIVDSSRLSTQLAAPAAPSPAKSRVHRTETVVQSRRKLASGLLSAPLLRSVVTTTTRGELNERHHSQHAAAVAKAKASHQEQLAKPASRAALSQPPAKQEQQLLQPATKKRGFITSIRGKSQGVRVSMGRALSMPQAMQRQRVLQQRSAHVRR